LTSVWDQKNGHELNYKEVLKGEFGKLGIRITNSGKNLSRAGCEE